MSGSGAGHAASTPSIDIAAKTVKVGAQQMITGTGFTPNNWAMLIASRSNHTLRVRYVETDANGSRS